MPWASHGVADQESLGQRSVVVRADRADGEVFVAAAGKQDRIVADMPLEHAAIGNLADIDARREVRSGCRLLRGTHRSLPLAVTGSVAQ